VPSVPPGVQGLICQELPPGQRSIRRKVEKKKRMRKKFNKEKSFGQLEMTFGLILA